MPLPAITMAGRAVRARHWNHLHMGVVAIDLAQLFEPQRAATEFYTFNRLLTQERLQLPICSSDTAGGGGRVEDD